MKIYEIHKRLMGSAFSLGVVADSSEEADHFLEMGISEIQRIESLLSEFLPESDTSKINKDACNGFVRVEKESYDLIRRCIAISTLTLGDFDISVSPLKKLFSFKNVDFEMPSPKKISETIEIIGYRFLKLNPVDQSVKFEKKNMAVSFSAIGKGYASDQVRKLWEKNGLSSGYINASGDLNAFGFKPDGEHWKVAIANPDIKDEALLYVNLKNTSVATSGDSEQHFMWKGKRYSHNINPHTGYPLSGIKSVSVFSPAAELSDALATAVYVKGVKNGIDFINQLPQSHCIIIDENNKLYFSENIEYEMQKSLNQKHEKAYSNSNY